MHDQVALEQGAHIDTNKTKGLWMTIRLFVPSCSSPCAWLALCNWISCLLSIVGNVQICNESQAQCDPNGSYDHHSLILQICTHNCKSCKSYIYTYPSWTQTQNNFLTCVEKYADKWCTFLTYWLCKEFEVDGSERMSSFRTPDATTRPWLLPTRAHHQNNFWLEVHMTIICDRLCEKGP